MRRIITRNHSVRCFEGRLWRHDPQRDDPDLETDIGQCPECEGKGCEDKAPFINQQIEDAIQ